MLTIFANTCLSCLGFITFIFMVGASVLGLGEWFIKRMPLVRHIYIAFKQISASISPDVRSWASKKFMAGCDFLFPIAITFYITWWFIHFVDGFFSPIYAQLGIDIFGLGFITSITFIFMVGVFMSSWLGASVLGLGEWFIKRMPLVRHIYNASKQISAAISPDQNTQAFKEVAIIRHPRIGECAFGFITSSAVLQNYSGDEELCCVYVPTNQEFVTIREPLLPEELSLRKLKAKGVPSKTTKPREGSTNMGKEIEERVSKRVAKEERTKRLKEVVQLDAKEIMPIENEKASGGKVDKKAKVKTISRKPQNGSRINKNDIHFRKSTASDTTSKPKAKVKTTGKKVPEKEVSKSKIVTKPQDQGEISSAKLRNPQNGSRINKNEIHFKKSTASDTTSKSKNQKINISKEQKKNHMKKQRHVADPEAAKPVAEQFGEEEKIIDISCDDDCTEIRITTTIADDLAVEHEVNASANNTGEDCKQSKSCSGDDILMLKSEHENATFPAEEAHESTNCCETDHKPDKEGSELKYLLLTNQSFISNEEELLNLELDCPKILPKNETNETANVRLYLDCANELTERKSLQESQVVRPLLLTYDAGNSRLHISLGKLVEEICNAIENLTCYSEKSRKKLGSSDSIYAMTERDMKCNGLINGIWNWGWRHGFSADEAEQVVNEVENLVFSELIEEVIVNL